MHLRGDSIYAAELRRPAPLASYVSFVIMFFAINQNMGPAQWGNTCWQKLTSQSSRNYKSKGTELTSSTVDETALAILKRQGSRGITIISSQSQIIFDIQVIPYWPKWQTKHYELATKNIETSKFHQDMWNRYIMSGFLSAHIPWNAIPNLELRRSYNALRHNLVLLSATSLSNICRKEYELTLDAIKKQLPSGNKVSLALDGWTSMTKLVTMSVIA